MTTNGDVKIHQMNMNNNEAWFNIDETTSGNLEVDDLRMAYDAWAQSYNKDLNEAKYNGPRMGAMKVAELVPDKNAKILDCACGTGMVGQELQALGYTNITGADMSEQSLEVSRSIGCYKDFHCGNVMTDGLPFKDGTFDAIVCVGTFIPGHVDQTVFPEFQRVVKSGGYIVISMRENYIHTGKEYVGGQLDGAIIKHVELGHWNYLARLRIPCFIEDFAGIVFVLQVR